MAGLFDSLRFSRKPRRPVRVRPSIELLEGREVPATFTVSNLNDAGAGSLRQAIADANGTGEPDNIVFQPGLSGTITLTTGQLNVTRPVTITGPGSAKLTISGNDASRIFLVDNGSTVVQDFAISGMTLTKGKATGTLKGGAIDVGSENLILNDMVLTDNTAEAGGGIHLGVNGRLTMSNSSLTLNKATANNGGAMFLDDDSLTVIRNSNISGNQTVAVFSGGGISLQTGGFLAIENSTISGNVATFSGGGIIAQPNTTLVLRNSTVSGNEGVDGGGILVAGEGSLTIENSTISSNKAKRDGGGLWVHGAAVGVIRNSTIGYNTANTNTTLAGHGGGIFILDAAPPTPALTLQSTLVAQNLRGTAGPREDIFGTVHAQSRLNLIGVDTGLSGITNGQRGNQVGTAATPIDPKLAPLGFNGGPTPTHALLPGSPAIDTGFNFTGFGADQRGGSFGRTFGAGTDIGAFEVQPPPQPPSPPAPVSQPRVEVLTTRVKGQTRVEVRVGGALRKRFVPFKGFTGRVQIQRADVNGDGLLDVVARATINGKKRTRTFTA